MRINSIHNINNEVILKNNKVLMIRNAEVEDACAIIEYLNIVGGESDNLLFGAGEFRLNVDQERAYIEDLSKDENSLMLVGVIENKVVSVALITGSNKKRIQHNKDLSISVKKEYWNSGVGYAMMVQLVDFAKRNQSIKNVSLGVRATNQYAIKLYEKLGFERIGIHKNFFCIDGNYYDEILMDLFA
jgi:RimJ/RimL family protein N-acetyltransferase